MRAFAKPALSIEKQVKLWKSRGLIIDNLDRAERYLQFISYYRLSPYTLPFQNSGGMDHQFKKATRFDDILDLYVFDRELRLLIMDPIERFEVALRSTMTNTMSTKFGAHWYLDSVHFKTGRYHGELIQKIQSEIVSERERLKRSLSKISNSSCASGTKKRKEAQERKQNFLRHYLSTYDTPSLPPCWMMVELLSFGDLKWFYKQLARDTDKKSIADQFHLPVPLLESWIGSIQAVRNICAHHGRLWNRELGLSPQMPKRKLSRWIQMPLNVMDSSVNTQRRTYIVLVILQYFMAYLNPGSGWKYRLKGLLDKYPRVSKAHMGMPEQWQEDPYWGFNPYQKS